ncbi:MAG: toll/interleukin-1 receptor domain-containing protein [Pseudomonadota bacterium]|nr:toll/interleukin-1 receptor domain-containing protein [Pseudomonadota bacterium]
MRYRAFISYSHKDAQWTRWLHRTLEGYQVPSRLRGSEGEFGPLPDRLTPVFRDREDLSSAGGLTPKIQEALDDSEALIVVCSPDAARSPWVNKEILRFKSTGRGNRISCLIVAGDPGAGDERECFAPALRFEPDADGVLGTEAAEPLAADVRPHKDGKSLARLKLLSGLLGVSLDTLRQREVARRQRRLLAISAVSVLVMLITSALAVQAVIARNAAERRQKQAEALVDFMLGDLSEKLSQVSRLDIMETVNNQAMAYFKSLPTTDVTAQSLEQRAQTLVKIGNVRRDQGHLPQALQSYQAAAALSQTLARSAPTDIKRQLAHAEILTYIGTARWYHDDLQQAETAFGAAQRVLLRARPLAPADPDLLYQLSTINNNMGHVLEGRGRIDQAQKQYEALLASSRELVGIDPGNSKWVAQTGLAHNNLAKMALLRGDLTTAIAQYKADLDIQAGLARRDPQANDQAERVVLSRAALGRTMALAGDVDAGIAHLRQALDEVARLLIVDAENTSFQEDDGLYAIELARWLRTAGDETAAQVQAARGLDVFKRLVRQDPANASWQRALAVAHIEQGAQARVRGHTATARDEARLALGILEPQLIGQAENRDTVLATVRARLLLAAVAEYPDRAATLRGQALATCKTQSLGQHDPRLRALQVEALLGLGRISEARALLPELWTSGFRDPRFIGLLREHRIPAPQHLTTSNHAQP